MDDKEKKGTEDDTPKEPQGSPLPFPLDLDTLDALRNGGFILRGEATLVSGTVTVTDRRIKPSSIALVSYRAIDGTLGAALEAVTSDGTLVITSYDSGSAVKTGDTSDVAYFVVL